MECSYLTERKRLGKVFEIVTGGLVACPVCKVVHTQAGDIPIKKEDSNERLSYREEKVDRVFVGGYS